jgi:plasmid stabilization system protein ParE
MHSACGQSIYPSLESGRLRVGYLETIPPIAFDAALARSLQIQRPMAQGSKAKYSNKQKRQAEHIEESYEKRGKSKKEAEKRAWQTVNKQTGGGEKSGGGRKATKSAKKAAREESGRRAAASRQQGLRKTQKKPTRHKASASAK